MVGEKSAVAPPWKIISAWAIRDSRAYKYIRDRDRRPKKRGKKRVAGGARRRNGMDVPRAAQISPRRASTSINEYCPYGALYCSVIAWMGPYIECDGGKAATRRTDWGIHW